MPRTSVNTLFEKKKKREPIVMLTAYDYTFARIVDAADVDVILVGDSLGMVVLGYPSTLPVTLDDMIRHTQAVARGAEHAMVVADMPFMSFQVSEDEAVRNAGTLISRGGCEGVKLEGGKRVVPAVRRMVEAGIPVMGHLGLTPQSVHQIGGYKVQGKSQESARHILEEAKLLEEAGCFSIVLECVPAELGEEMSKQLSIPVIGIGAGNQCDGQVLVLYDCLGLTRDLRPKFVKPFANLGEEALKGINGYVEEVKNRTFPSLRESFL